MRSLVHHDLNTQSRTTQDKAHLTETTRLRRMERRKLLLNFMKSSHTVRIFSDERLFHDGRPTGQEELSMHLRQACRRGRSEDSIQPVNKHPKEVMVLEVVGSDGKKCTIGSTE